MKSQRLQPNSFRLAACSARELAFFLAAPAARANVGGRLVSGNFNMTASAGYVLMPDGASIYAWGYGEGAGELMQLPGPTMIITQGATVTISLTNNLPLAAGNTSIVFPGLSVTAAGGVPGVVAQEAVHGGSVSYTFTASKPGTYLYHSGTRSDLQVEMGLYGAIVVRPSSIPAGCSAAAYNHPDTCFDREYLVRAERDPGRCAQSSGVAGTRCGPDPGADRAVHP